MMIKIRYLAVLCLLLLVTSDAMSKSLFINCPLRDVESGVTSSITSPWWSTPVVYSPTQVEVGNVGGKSTLTCRYGNNPSRERAVVRNFPPNYENCRTDGNGFRCTKGSNTLTIRCPTSRVESGVLGRITHPWWSTPYIGNLLDVEVTNVAGRPALMCLYQTHRSVPVMRPFPPGYDSCRVEGDGFRCDGSTSTSAVGNVSKKHTETVKSNKSTSVGNVSKKHTQSVKSSKNQKSASAKITPSTKSKDEFSCTDLKITKILVDDINRRPDKSYDFTLYGYLVNASGSDWVSSEGQQSVYIYKNKELARDAPFQNMYNNTSTGFHLEVQNWKLNNPNPPNYSYRITYDPDIHVDGNDKNNDCSSKNNTMTISGEKINKAIRESGM